MSLFSKAGTASLVLTATGVSPGVLRNRRTASALVVLSRTSSAIPAKLASGSARVILTAGAVCSNPNRPTFSFSRVILKVRARALAPGVDFGGDYLGRFQQGQEVPLWVVVRDQDGRPQDPSG